MISVELTEWGRATAEQNPALTDRSLIEGVLAAPIIELLRDRLNIFQTHIGLEIASTSFVGRVDVGQLRVSIRPKLSMMPLARLLRYAYGLRDLTTLEETQAPTARFGLHDLLIAMLIAEVEELLQRGPARRYVELSDKLECPRGRILVERLVREGGIKEARLPCRYFERHINWHLNQVVRAGLDLAAEMTEDREVRRHLHKLAAEFEDVNQPSTLRTAAIDRAERELTRLTAAYMATLTIIRLLHDAQGLHFQPESYLHRIPGFLFDMNSFFQRLISRFLHDNLTAQHIVDEWGIRTVFAYAPYANPKNRSAPKPRPDYALFRGNSLRSFLDAKYRDIWERGFPAEWLYQLGMYALGSPARLSVLLYASMSPSASDEQIDIRPPVHWQNAGSSSVIFRPVPLQRMAELLERPRDAKFSAQRRQMAAELVRLRPGRLTQVHDRAQIRAA